VSANSKWGRELLTHLDAAYNLARWLTKNEQDAKDIAHDAFVRAFRFQAPVENVRAWFLTVVRNTAYTAMKKQAPLASETETAAYANLADGQISPEEHALNQVDVELIRQALGQLPEEYREVFILRELEDLSYQEISEVVSAPIGTVMSRLARARRKILALVEGRTE
jgi:RNA polymerase sigma-70 factor (ECF subfamily)